MGQRRSLGYVVGASIGAAVIVALVSFAPGDPCQARHDLAATIDANLRSSVTAALNGSPLPYGADHGARIEARLARHDAEWRRLVDVSCQQADGAPLDPRLDLCLHAHRERLGHLLAMLTTPSPSDVQHALGATTRGTDLSRCATPALLAAMPPLPGGVDVQNDVAQLATAVERIRAEWWLRRVRSAAAAAEQLRERIEARPYLPLQASFALLRARIEAHTDPRAAAAILRTAIPSAEHARDHEVEAALWLDLVAHTDGPRADRIAREVRPRIARLPPDHRLEAVFHAARSGDALARARFGDAANDLAAAANIARRRDFPEHAQYQTARLDALLRAGEVERADALVDTLLADVERSHGRRQSATGCLQEILSG